MKMRLKYLAVLAAWTLGSNAQADLLNVYEFTGGVLTSSDTEGSSTSSAITTGSSLGSSGGVSSPGHSGSGGSFQFAAANMGTALDTNAFISFTVTANSGFFNLSGSTLSFHTSSQSSKSGCWALRSSLDGFAAALGGDGLIEAGAGTAWNQESVTLGSAFNNQSAVTFRLYGWNTNGGSSEVPLYADNITLNGPTPVAESVSVVLGLFAGSFMGALAIRRLARVNRKSKQGDDLHWV